MDRKTDWTAHFSTVAQPWNFKSRKFLLGCVCPTRRNPFSGLVPCNTDISQNRKKMNGFSSIERISISLWGVEMPDSSHLTVSAEWNLLTAHSHKHTLGLILICSMNEWGSHPLDNVSYLLGDNCFVLCHSKYRCNSCTGNSIYGWTECKAIECHDSSSAVGFSSKARWP